MIDGGKDIYTLHLGLNEELEVIEVGTTLDMLVPRDVGLVTFIKLVDEGTLDVDRRLRKKVLGDLLAGGDGSDLSAMVRFAAELRRVDGGVGAVEWA
jgi:hypothetical protein